MATKIAVYKFNDYDDWNAATNRLYEALGSGNYSDSITTETNWVTIWDNCNDPRTAAKICSGHNGEAY
jgi:hypothetical protein